MGRYTNNNDQLHLGSSGFRVPARLIKEKVCGSRLDGRSLASVVRRSEVRSDQWRERESKSKNSGLNENRIVSESRSVNGGMSLMESTHSITVPAPASALLVITR